MCHLNDGILYAEVSRVVDPWGFPVGAYSQSRKSKDQKSSPEHQRSGLKLSLQEMRQVANERRILQQTLISYLYRVSYAAGFLRCCTAFLVIYLSERYFYEG